MLADSLVGLVAAAFPLPHLPPMESNFIPAVHITSGEIKLVIRNFSILVQFGAAGLFIAGVWGASRAILVDKSRGEAQFGSQWENSF